MYPACCAAGDVKGDAHEAQESWIPAFDSLRTPAIKVYKVRFHAIVPLDRMAYMESEVQDRGI